MVSKKINNIVTSTASYKYILFFSLICRLIFASVVELGNDEVYYTLYPLHPGISHFDHPPLVGWFIYLTTFNLSLTHEIFVRLGAVIASTISSLYFYKSVKLMTGVAVANIALILYSSSIYAFVIAGVFIMPDGPLMLFWILSFFCIVQLIEHNFKSTKWFMLFGLFSGLAIYSKYHAIFIWFGLVLYLLIYNRKTFLNFKVYLSLLFPLFFGSLILIWNYQNDFISFGFHTDRVSVVSQGIKWNYFLTEFSGEIAYSNPLNWILIICSLFFIKKIKKILPTNYVSLIFLFSFPLVLLVWYFSLSKPTLPHWVGPSFSVLLILPAVLISSFKSKWISSVFIYPAFLVLLMLPLAIGVINLGWLLPKDSQIPLKKGKDDFTLDMYGWKQTKEKYYILLDSLINAEIIVPDLPLISNNWFPAAHIDFYIAQPINQKLFCVGSTSKIHEYHWINYNRDIQSLKSGLFLMNSRNYIKNVNKYWQIYFEKVTLLSKFPIVRNGKVVEYVFLYKLENFKGF